MLHQYTNFKIYYIYFKKINLIHFPLLYCFYIFFAHYNYTHQLKYLLKETFKQ